MTTVHELGDAEALFRTADLIPLGRGPGLIDTDDALPSDSGSRPLGLGFAHLHRGAGDNGSVRAAL